MLNADLQYATETAEASLSDDIANAEGALAGANDERKAWMASLTEERTLAFEAYINGEKDKVNAWFDDQTKWAEKLYESYYKEHLLQTLQSRRDAALDSLDERLATSFGQAVASNAQLADNLDAEESSLAAFNADMLAALMSFNDQLQAATAASASDINNNFAAAADGENAAK